MHVYSRVMVGVVVAGAVAFAQPVPDTVEGHVAAATAAAGAEYGGLVNRLCTPPAPAAPRPAAQPATPRPTGAPAKETWYAKPVKVFDNLYFIGQTEYSAWAVTTSEGIIVIDPIFDYSVEDEVVGGLRALGFDPANIKYVLVSHAHYDHVGGASYFRIDSTPR